MLLHARQHIFPTRSLEVSLLRRSFFQLYAGKIHLYIALELMMNRVLNTKAINGLKELILNKLIILRHVK